MSTYETAEFGNHGGSHQLLSSSLPSNAAVLDEIRFLVDRPAGHVGSEVAWSPYWGCGSVSGYWALWRGEEDCSAPRKNMVKARVVLVPIAQCELIENFDDLLSAVGYSVPEEDILSALTLAGAAVDCLARGKGPAIIPNLSIAPLLIRAIWPRLWANARASLSLRTLFGVESLETSYPSRIVVIPEELRPRWQAYPLLDGKAVSSSAVTRWFSGDTSAQLENLIAANVTKLPSDLNVLERLERIAECLERLHSGVGTIADALLVVRTVEAFTEGLTLPKEDIHVVADMLGKLQHASVGEVRTASLVRLEIFDDRSGFEVALSRWIVDRLPEQSIEHALWILEHHAGALHSDWWCAAVGKGIAAGCKSKNPAWAQALWRWWIARPNSLQQTKEYLPVDAKCEDWISGFAPAKVDDELLTVVVNVCHERKWASLLAIALGATRPLKYCIEVLRDTVPNPETGLTILLSKRSANEIIDVAAEVSWEPLHAKAVLHTVKSPQLLARVTDYRKLVPLLLRHLSARGEFPTELLTNTFFAKLFDAIVKGDESSMKIVKHFGRSEGHYLLGHPEERMLWDILLPVVSDDFVVGAADEWWERFLKNEQIVRPARQLCERVLKSALSRVKRKSITLVIRLLTLFPEITEAQFQEWMSTEGFSWVIGDHKILADLLLERKWRSSAKEFRWSWKSELQIVAWHARKLLSWSDKFRNPPEGTDQTWPDKTSMAAEGVQSRNKMKILFLAANPISFKKLALDKEAHSIEDKIRDAKHRDSVEFVTQWAIRPSDLQQAILEHEPTIVHFSGHGGGSIGIVMHSATMGDDSLVSSEALAELFKVLNDGIRVVVLNACYSEEQAKAIVNHVDFVVGMSDSIGDEAARMFAVAFYRGLSFGKSVQTAFDLGINELSLVSLSKNKKIPQLLVRSGIDAATTILVSDAVCATHGFFDGQLSEINRNAKALPGGININIGRTGASTGHLIVDSGAETGISLEALDTIGRMTAAASDGTQEIFAKKPTKKLATMPQVELLTEARYVQCKIFNGKSGSESVKRLENRHHYRACIHIGSDIDEAALPADMPFDESQLPASEKGHDLQIVFCSLDTRAEKDGIVPAIVKTIHLPKQGNSGVAEFTFDSGEDGQAFRARILIMHHNRILQTLMLSAPEHEAEFALRQENMVSPAFASSASEAPTDLALVINDNPAGVSGITAVTEVGASFSEPAGLDVTINTLKSLLSKTNIDTAGEDIKLDHPKLVGLMIQLANHGVALMRELERQINMPAFQLVARIQVVEARSKAYLPVEFVYTGKPPKIDAKLCPNAKKALAAADGSVHAACEHANDPQYVCPAAFWGFCKCIERHPFGQSEQHVFSIPQPGADTLAPFKAALLAASTRVLAVDLTGVNGVEPAIAAVTKDVRLAKSWEDWKQNILTEPYASMLVLLPHTDNSPDIVNMPALEIQEKWLTSVELDSDYVQPTNEVGPGPVVLLLGCSTALTDIAFLNFVREFKGAGASIVLGTLATVHGAHASRFVRVLLGKMKSKSNGRPFDEILLEVKREMLAEGEPFVLSLAAYGHSSWRIQT